MALGGLDDIATAIGAHVDKAQYEDEDKANGRTYSD